MRACTPWRPPGRSLFAGGGPLRDADRRTAAGRPRRAAVAQGGRGRTARSGRAPRPGPRAGRALPGCGCVQAGRGSALTAAGGSRAVARLPGRTGWPTAWIEITDGHETVVASGLVRRDDAALILEIESAKKKYKTFFKEPRTAPGSAHLLHEITSLVRGRLGQAAAVRNPEGQPPGGPGRPAGKRTGAGAILHPGGGPGRARSLGREYPRAGLRWTGTGCDGRSPGRPRLTCGRARGLGHLGRDRGDVPQGGTSLSVIPACHLAPLARTLNRRVDWHPDCGCNLDDTRVRVGCNRGHLGHPPVTRLAAGITFGIWACNILGKPEVTDAFFSAMPADGFGARRGATGEPRASWPFPVAVPVGRSVCPSFAAPARDRRRGSRPVGTVFAGQCRGHGERPGHEPLTRARASLQNDGSAVMSATPVVRWHTSVR